MGKEERVVKLIANLRWAVLICVSLAFFLFYQGRGKTLIFIGLIAFVALYNLLALYLPTKRWGRVRRRGFGYLIHLLDVTVFTLFLYLIKARLELLYPLFIILIVGSSIVYQLRGALGTTLLVSLLYFGLEMELSGSFLYLDKEALFSKIVIFFLMGISAGYLSRDLSRQRQSKEQASALYEIGKSLNSAQSLEEVFNLILEATTSLLRVETCVVMLLDKKKEELVISAFRGPGLEGSKGYGVSKNIPFIDSTLSSKKPLVVPDVKKMPELKGVLFKKDAQSFASVPLVAEDKAIGTLNISNPFPYDFPPGEIQLLSIVASQAAVAIERTQLYKRLQANYLSSIAALAATLDAKDPYTSGHSQQVSKYTVAIAKRMGLAKKEVENIYYASLLHDLGKISIREEILNKPGKLTKEEFAAVTTHPSMSANIIREAEFLRELIPLILYHHERYEGGGYPGGLKGEEIPQGARILTVADSFQAMTSDRPYRKTFSREEAKQELKGCSGSQFDPQIVKAFLEILEEEEENHDE